MNLLAPNGSTSLASAAAKSGVSPGPVDIVTRLDKPGDYLVLLNDSTRDNDPGESDFDRHSPYAVAAYVTSDPDVNEPNEDPSTPTYIPGGGPWTQNGAIAITGDVDWFTLDAPRQFSRQILYVNITAPAVPPPAQVRLASSVYECPSPPASSQACGKLGKVVSEDSSLTPIGEQHVVTARVIGGGRYAIKISSFKSPNDSSPAPADPRLKYTITARLFEDVDGNEGTTGNDSQATATAVSASGGTVRGRLSYVADADWYALNFSAGAARRVHYKVSYTGAAGRFSISGSTPREMNVQVPYPSAGWTRCGCCSGGNTSCGAYCARGLCLRSKRVEDPDVERTQELGNFEGIINVPATGASQTLFFQYWFVGGLSFDDREYQIVFEVLSPDASEGGSSLVLPALGTSGSASVTIGYGYQSGRTSEVPPNQDRPVLRGEEDYDDEDDTDTVDIRLPAGLPAADYTWDLSWSIPPAPGRPAGSRPYDVTFSFDYGGGNGSRGDIGWIGSARQPWCATSCGSNPIYSFDQGGGSFGVNASACMCLRSAYVTSSGGTIRMQVSGVNRARWADSPVQVTMRLSSYPTGSCPTPCGF